MLTGDQIVQFSKRFRIDQVSVLREYIQLNFLSALYRSEMVKKTYFKGGTCLRLIFGSGRFSEDLDFTTDLSAVQIDREIVRALVPLGQEFPGIMVKKIKVPAGFSRKLHLIPEGISQPLTIKLDFSIRETVLDPEVSIPKSEYPLSVLLPVAHLSMKEIFSEKIRALMLRKKGRDLYDIYYLLGRNVPVEKDFIQKKLDFYNEILDFSKLETAVSEWNSEDLKRDLGQFLPQDVRPIVSNLPSLTIKLLRERLIETQNPV